MKVKELLDKYGYSTEDEVGLELHMELYEYDEDITEVWFSTDNSSGAKYRVDTIEDVVEALRKYFENNM